MKVSLAATHSVDLIQVLDSGSGFRIFCNLHLSVPSRVLYPTAFGPRTMQESSTTSLDSLKDSPSIQFACTYDCKDPAVLTKQLFMTATLLSGLTRTAMGGREFASPAGNLILLLGYDQGVMSGFKSSTMQGICTSNCGPSRNWTAHQFGSNLNL